MMPQARPTRAGVGAKPTRHAGRGGSDDRKAGGSGVVAVGRFGQFLGLAIPALAVLLELNRSISLGQMLMMLVAAVCCFWIGRIVEGYATAEGRGGRAAADAKDSARTHDRPGNASPR